MHTFEMRLSEESREDDMSVVNSDFIFVRAPEGRHVRRFRPYETQVFWVVVNYKHHAPPGLNFKR